jgi:serine/threonine-protein kinase RsbW
MPAEQRHFDGGLEQMGHARGWLEERLRAERVAAAEIDAVLLAFTEAYTNILRHAYRGLLPAPLDVELWISPIEVAVVLRDRGQAFQPEGTTAPAPEELAEGGYGLFLIEALMDEVRYSPAGEAGTELRLKKQRASLHA